MPATSQIQVGISKTCVEAGIKSFTLELDSEKNRGQSTFPPGEFAYVRCFPAILKPELRVSMGTARLEAEGIPLSIEDEVTFARSKGTSLRYPYHSNFEWEWVGREGPPPKVTGEGTILLSEEFSGILKIKYQTMYDRIEVHCTEEASVLLEAIKEDRYGHITLKWKPETREVYLTVRDACTRTIIPSVYVWVDGKYVGTTDLQGRIYLGKLKVGTHSLKMSKHGYQDSDSDTIANDSFTVS